MMENQSVCPDCGGTGKIVANKCPDCGEMLTEKNGKVKCSSCDYTK